MSPGASFEYVITMVKLKTVPTGKACLYINKIEDIDLAVLEDLIRQSVDFMKTRYES